MFKFTKGLLFVFFCQIATSQIVNIPEGPFKTALLNHVPVIDINNDGEIQVSEAEVITEITATSQGILYINGIEGFTNLEELNLYDNPLYSGVDLSNNTQLKVINFGLSGLSEIDLIQNTELISINLFQSQLDAIDLSTLINLEFIDLGETNIQSIDVSNNTNLRYLDISATNVEELVLTNNNVLEGLSVASTLIADFDFSIIPSLKIIDVSNTEFIVLDFSNNPDLCSITAQNCPLLTTINLQNGNNVVLGENLDCTITFTIGSLTVNSGLVVDIGNPSLNYIIVDDIQFAIDNFSLVPSQTQFTEDTSVLSVHSFSNFELVLMSNLVSNNLILNSAKPIESIAVYAINGSLLFNKFINNSTAALNISGISNGLYFISVTDTDGRIEILKFIKK